MRQSHDTPKAQSNRYLNTVGDAHPPLVTSRNKTVLIFYFFADLVLADLVVLGTSTSVSSSFTCTCALVAEAARLALVTLAAGSVTSVVLPGVFSLFPASSTGSAAGVALRADERVRVVVIGAVAGVSLAVAEVLAIVRRVVVRSVVLGSAITSSSSSSRDVLSSRVGLCLVTRFPFPSDGTGTLTGSPSSRGVARVPRRVGMDFVAVIFAGASAFAFRAFALGATSSVEAGRETTVDFVTGFVSRVVEAPAGRAVLPLRVGARSSVEVSATLLDDCDHQIDFNHCS
jgi:hypothetical protein